MIKWLQNLKKDIGQSQHQDLWHYAEMLDEVIGTIESRPKGKWVRITQGAIPEQYICPFCHRTVGTYDGVEGLLSIRYPYCHCGADMRGEQE